MAENNIPSGQGIVTELEVTELVIQGGRKIAVNAYHTQNVQIHTLFQLLSNTMIYIIDSASNNTADTLTFEDQEVILKNYQHIKDEYEFAFANRGVPASSVIEENLKILIPTRKEMARMPNMNLKQVNQQFLQLATIILGLSLNKTSMFISNKDDEKIRKNIEYTDRLVARWIGVDETDTGVQIYGLDRPQILAPDLDMDYSTLNEPNPNTTVGAFPDVLETPASEVSGTSV